MPRTKAYGKLFFEKKMRDGNRSYPSYAQLIASRRLALIVGKQVRPRYNSRLVTVSSGRLVTPRQACNCRKARPGIPAFDAPVGSK
jgi:hypothetical protein